MKNVYLIGDSIRMNYQDAVADNLKGKANVLHPGYIAEGESMEQSRTDENCRWTGYTLNSLCAHIWLRGLPELDAIHYNNGIWDIVVRHEEDGSFTPIDEYERNVRRILRELKKLTPNIIIATTTPPRVDNRSDPTTGKETLSLEAVQSYNAVLLKIAAEQNLPVNDLFSLVYSNREMYIRADDEVHLSDEGIKACGEQTAKIIEKYL